MENKVKEFLQEKKLFVVTGLLSFSFLTAILTIRKKTTKIPSKANKSALKALGIATSIVGVSFGGIGYGISKYCNVSSLEEFDSMANSFIKDSFLKIELLDKEDNVGQQFMKEWNDNKNNL